jgi:hypothetical protein
MAMLVFFLALAICVPVTLAMWWWIAAPVDRAAKERKCPGQLMLIDLFGLFTLLQLMLSPVFHSFGGRTGRPQDNDNSTYWPFCIPIAFVAALIWWTTVQAMSRAGVRRAWHRIFFGVVIYPITIVGSFGQIFLAFVLAQWIDAGDTSDVPSPIWPLAAEAALVVAWYFCGRFSRHMLAAALADQTRGAGPPTPP